MNDLFSRKFTRRRIGLLLILCLILLAGLYFCFVHYPVSSRMSEIDGELAEILSDTEAAQSRCDTYQSMKAELEEIFAMPDDKVTVMPEYDNIQTLMVCFDQIFAGADPTLNFDAVHFDNNIAARTVRFSFTAASYDQAKQILGQLTGTGFRCLMTSFSVEPADGDGEIESGKLEVSGTITFYELAPQDQG